MHAASKGGLSEQWNFVPVCTDCNDETKSRHLFEQLYNQKQSLVALCAQVFSALPRWVRDCLSLGGEADMLEKLWGSESGLPEEVQLGKAVIQAVRDEISSRPERLEVERLRLHVRKLEERIDALEEINKSIFDVVEIKIAQKSNELEDSTNSLTERVDEWEDANEEIEDRIDELEGIMKRILNALRVPMEPEPEDTTEAEPSSSPPTDSEQED